MKNPSWYPMILLRVFLRLFARKISLPVSVLVTPALLLSVFVYTGLYYQSTVLLHQTGRSRLQLEAVTSCTNYLNGFDRLFPNWSPQAARYSAFQPIGETGLQSYVYSVYLDDRRAADVDPQLLPVVRIFAWIRRGENVTENWRCLLWFNELRHPVDVPVIAWINLNPTFPKDVVPSMLICPHRARAAGNDVSATSDLSAMALTVVTSRCGLPSNAVRVLDLTERRRLTSSGEAVFYPSVNFTISVPPIFGSYYTAADVVEFIEVNRVFGVQKFVFYVQPPLGEHVLDCLRHYERLGVVDVLPFTLPSDVVDHVHYHGQILAINDQLFRVTYTTRYVISQDLDEFVVPQRADSWTSMIGAILAEHPDPDSVVAFSFRQRMFPLNLPDATTSPSVGSASAPTTSTPDPVLSKFRPKTLTKLRADVLLTVCPRGCKIMARPDRVKIWHVHLLGRGSLIRQKVDVLHEVPERHGVLHHYRKNGQLPATRNVTRMRHFERQILDRLRDTVTYLEQRKIKFASGN